MDLGSNDDVLLRRSLEAYARKRLPNARDVRVTSLSRIPGGASRETYRFTLVFNNDAGEYIERRLILRRDPASSLVESERRVEFGAFRALRATCIPVPEMLWLEEDTSHLGNPFFVAEEIIGCQADPSALIRPPYDAMSERIGQQAWSILGEIAKIDVEAIGYTDLFEKPALDQPARAQLDYWCGVLERKSIRAEPITEAVVRWMRRNPPAPCQRISVVHGDYRSGNFLYDHEGVVRAILDWEMTHLGDPLEDLAWSLSRAFCVGKDDRRGGLLSKEKAIHIWEESSGLVAEPAALHWWELLACVKGQALWASAARSWIEGSKRGVINLVIAWMAINSQDRIALELMGHL